MGGKSSITRYLARIHPRGSQERDVAIGSVNPIEAIGRVRLVRFRRTSKGQGDPTLVRNPLAHARGSDGGAVTVSSSGLFPVDYRFPSFSRNSSTINRLFQHIDGPEQAFIFSEFENQRHIRLIFPRYEIRIVRH